jgi:type IV pilus assembly protein PilA
MQGTISRMRKRGDEDRGFTMIELLVVVVIIGVLVAIAVPVYLNYRKGAANKSAASDVRGAITAVEQYYTDNGNVYPATATSGTGAPLLLVKQTGGTDQTISVSPANILSVHNTSAAGVNSYHICAQNQDGLEVYVYNNKNSSSVKKTSSTMTVCGTSGA